MDRRDALCVIGTAIVAFPALADTSDKKGKPMKFELPKLNYQQGDLAPIISAETIEYHYGKHHAAYITNLNNLIVGTEFENKSLEDIVKTSNGAIFNNSAQAWNHSFYWECLTAKKGTKPSPELQDAINKKFGSKEAFIEQFNKSAVGNFGSGWTWLVKNSDGSLEILNTSNAATPLTQNKKAILTVDVWEHAYYIDYRNARPKYCEKIWEIVNWDFASKNFA